MKIANRKSLMISAAATTAAAALVQCWGVRAFADPVAYWRFEEGPANANVIHTIADGQFEAAIADSSGNGNTLSVWSNGGGAGYQYRTDVPFALVPKTGATDNFSVKNTGGGPAMFTGSATSLPTGVDIETMMPNAFTIEASFKPENGGFRTIVGRDAENVSTSNPALAALYLQARPDNSVGINFTDAAGLTHEAFSAPGLIHGFDFGTDPDGTTGTWYNVAAVSDGTTLKMYVNGALVASSSLDSTDARLAVGTTSGSDWHAGEWSVGRGLFNGGHADRGYGYIDEVRISNTALATSNLLVPISSLLYTWTDGDSSFGTGSNWDRGTMPQDVQFHQALVNNGGTVEINGTGSFNVSDLWVGSGSSGVGHIVQSGATFRVGNTLILGQNGGTGDYDLSAGTLNASAVTVAGGGSTLNTATLTVRGTGVMNVSGILNVAGGGGTLNAGTMVVRDSAAVNVTGGQAVRLGNTGTANFTLQDTAQFNTGTSEFWVGNGSSFSFATANVTGGTLNVNNWLAVGRDRSNGTLNISGTGVVNKTGNGNITIGAVDNGTFNSTGVINQTGGQIVSVRNAGNISGVVDGEMYVGETTRGKATWNFSGGSASAPVVNIGYQGQGSLNMSGTAQLNTPYLGVARAGTFGGVANLNGGTATVGQLFRGASVAPATVNFNGTTIVPTADNDRFVAGFGTAELVLQSGGAVINTNGKNIGVDGGFSGTGPLIKNGAGVLTLNAAATNTHSGNTVVNAGTLKLQHVVSNNSLLANNVAAFYKFDNASNLGKDSSPNGNDVTSVFGTATISTATAPLNHTASLSLPNNTTNRDFLSTGDSNVPTGFPTGNSSYTVAAWINVDGTTNTNGIVGWGDLGATPNLTRSSITFRTQNNNNTPNGLLHGWFAADTTGNLGAGTTLVNQWHHVVATYDANTDNRRIYVDGALFVNGLLPGQNNAGSQNFRIGMATLNEPFSGNMADLLVAGSALTPAQVQQLYTSGVNFGSFSGPTGALSPNSIVQIASGATLDMNGASSPSGGLGNVGGSGGTVTSSTAGNAVLTLSPVGSTSFSGVIQNGAGTVGIAKSGLGTQVLSGNNTYTGTTTVQHGGLVLAGAGAQSAVLGAGRGGADVQGGRLIFDYSGGSSPQATVVPILKASHDNNGFNNTNQIRSTTADGSKGLGYNDDGTSKFTIGYTYYGDSNLDNTVDLTDFTFLAANFNKVGGATWLQGDYNYDGNVDLTDFTFLAANFNKTLSPGDTGGGGSLGAAVPEPASLTLMLSACAAAGATRRRRRLHA
jgi:autotransporter-associated beta strand protein